MALVRWRPGADLISVREELDRLFDDLFDRVMGRSFPEKESVWSPDLDLLETDKEFVLNAELPGMTKDDIKISFKDNVLVIEGSKKQEKEEKKGNYLRVERQFGSFKRAVELPLPVDTEKAKASFKDGVLRVVLAKKPEAMAKEIPISLE